MKIIPVIDLLGGVVVRGVGGLRDQYRPIQSQLCESSEPMTVATALRDKLGESYLYVADLDAIRSGTLNADPIKSLAAAGFELLLDAGAFEFRQVNLLMSLGVQDVIIGLETLTDPEVLRTATDRYDDRIVFSLDLKANWPLTTDRSPWRDMTADQIADEAIAMGVKRMIVLDLHSIGRSSGVATLELCKRIRKRHPNVRLITGGGVRSREDITALADSGLDGVMVASALHDGRL